MDTAGKSEHVLPKQHMKYMGFCKTGSEKAEKHCQTEMQSWQNPSCCISKEEAFVFHLPPFYMSHCPENQLLNTESVSKTQVHINGAILVGDKVIASKQPWKTNL